MIINSVLQYNITPLASVLYYMRAKAERDPILAIILYKMSAIHANTILSLLLFGKEERTILQPHTITTKPIQKPKITITQTAKPLEKITKKEVLTILLAVLALIVVVLALRGLIVTRREHTYYP